MSCDFYLLFTIIYCLYPITSILLFFVIFVREAVFYGEIYKIYICMLEEGVHSVQMMKLYVSGQKSPCVLKCVFLNYDKLGLKV